VGYYATGVASHTRTRRQTDTRTDKYIAYLVYYAAVSISRIASLASPSVRPSFPYRLVTQKQEGAEKPK